MKKRKGSPFLFLFCKTASSRIEKRFQRHLDFGTFLVDLPGQVYLVFSSSDKTYCVGR